MNKKTYFLVLLLCVFAASIHAKRVPPPEVEDLTKGCFTYSAAYSFTGSWKSGYDFGVIVVVSNENPERKFLVPVPVYAVKLDEDLEYDVQWNFIKSMEFKNEETIKIVNEENQVFEFNINTYEVKCISGKSGLNVRKLYESKVEEFMDKIKKHEYKGIQPKEKKLSKIDDVIQLVENTLFPIYGEEVIKEEMPYVIEHVKDKWYVQGTLSEESLGGVFEIIINAQNSKIESLVHGE